MSNKNGKLFFLALAATVIAAILPLTGCGEEEKQQKEPEGIVKKFKGAPGVLTLKLDHKEITVAQPLTLSLTTRSTEDWKVTFPEFKDKLGEFTVRSSKEEAPVLSDDGKQKNITLIAVLDPYLAGEYKLPPLTVKFTNNKNNSYDINTEEIIINVSSVIPPDDKKPALRDISQVVELPFKVETWMIIVTTAVLVLLIAGIVAIIKRRKNHNEFVRVMLPHEIALTDLEKLLSGDLLKTGHIKEFYLEMTGILRHYIERRFSLAAPERTTEEFLEELRTDPALNADHKKLLKEFLRHCDLVKFARHQPGSEDIKNSVGSCRAFIEETKPQPEPELEEIK